MPNGPPRKIPEIQCRRLLDHRQIVELKRTSEAGDVTQRCQAHENDRIARPGFHHAGTNVGTVTILEHSHQGKTPCRLYQPHGQRSTVNIASEQCKEHEKRSEADRSASLPSPHGIDYSDVPPTQSLPAVAAMAAAKTVPIVSVYQYMAVCSASPQIFRSPAVFLS